MHTHTLVRNLAWIRNGKRWDRRRMVRDREDIFCGWTMVSVSVCKRLPLEVAVALP